jgi:sugar/nucleoside kinase (ribokinase family)
MAAIDIDPSRKAIAAVGSALMDLCLFESDDFVKGSEAEVGGMVMVDYTVIEGLLAKTAEKPSVVPGGSACNTIVGVGRLGGKARFVGKRGDDALGRTLEESIAEAGVEPVLYKSPAAATGRVLSMITPDAQRSMLTYLGASSEVTPEEVRTASFGDCAVVHFEGYLLFNPYLFKTALAAAKAAGALVPLDLASYNVVAASLELLNEVVDGGLVDIVLANEDEAAAFTGLKNEGSAAKALGERAPIAVMKLGKRGSVIMRGGGAETVTVAPFGDGRPAVDTTGAGDLWAGGFLYGLVNGYALEKCGELASMCGYEVCQVAGAHIPKEGWERILKSL